MNLALPTKQGSQDSEKPYSRDFLHDNEAGNQKG